MAKDRFGMTEGTIVYSLGEFRRLTCHLPDDTMLTVNRQETGKQDNVYVQIEDAPAPNLLAEVVVS